MRKIPFYSLENAPHSQLCDHFPDQFQKLLSSAYRLLTPFPFYITEPLSRRWLAQNVSPFKEEIFQIADFVRSPGIVSLNILFEWGCTTGVSLHKGFPAITRVLDWGLNDMGTTLVMVQHETEAGSYINLTWPGFAGVIQGMAPGRFSAAINQAPLTPHGRTFMGDWLTNRIHVYKSSHWPPAHLVRHVFETATSYEEAKQRLQTEPLCIPALFSLVGTEPHELCVIERTQDQHFTHEGSNVIANQWLNNQLRGHPRGSQNRDRCLMMKSLTDS